MAIQNRTKLEVVWKISSSILQKKKDELHFHVKGMRPKWTFEEWVTSEKMEMHELDMEERVCCVHRPNGGRRINTEGSWEME